MERVGGVLRRRWHVALTIAILGSVAVGVRLRLRPPRYVSKGMVQVGFHGDATAASKDLRGTGLAAKVFQTQLELIKSEQVIAGATERSLQRALPSGEARRDALEEYLDHVHIAPLRDTFLVEVTGVGHDPELAARRVNGLLDVYTLFANRFVGSRFVVEEREARQREEEIRHKLEVSRKTLQAFLNKQGNVQFESRRKTLSTRAEELHARVTELKVGRATADVLLQRLKANLDPENTEPLEVLLGRLPQEANRPEQELLAPVWTLRASLLEVSTTLSAKHPEHEALRLRLAAVTGAVRVRIRELSALESTRLEQRLRVLKDEEQRVDALMGENKQEQLELDTVELATKQLQGEVDWFDKELESTREQKWRAQSRAKVQAAASIVSRGEVPTEPLPTFPIPLVILAVMGMTALGVVVVLVWDHVEDKVTSIELAEQFGPPVLGRIPLVAGDETEVVRRAASAEPSPSGEAFRLLRTNLTFAVAGLRGGAIVVTSGMPQEGKTFTSIQLAVVLAQTHTPTLLIEGDLRRPRVQSILGTLHKRGLSDVLAGLATLEETCQETDFEGLHLLPSGTCPPNPTDLLARGRFDQVLQAALERYQSVVIDSPPVLGMADTSLLASHARGVLFVVRLNESRRRGVRSALEQIRASGAETAGLVVNGVPNRSPYGAYDSERPASAPPPSSDG